MALSAAVLLVTSVSGAPAVEITPISLAVRAPVVDLGDAQYDWRLQQGPRAAGQKLATQTAHCNTVMSTTNNGKDTVPDCGFD